jgi:hypothetical protein
VRKISYTTCSWFSIPETAQEGLFQERKIGFMSISGGNKPPEIPCFATEMHKGTFLVSRMIPDSAPKNQRVLVAGVRSQ